MKKIIQIIQTFSDRLISQAPSWLDALLFSALSGVALIQPYYLYGKMNLFEWGIYLPGIASILDGRIPFRDFFYLRGPFEIYVPAFAMHLWGENTSILATYFYIGTLLTFLLCILIGKEIYKSKLILFLVTLVLTARTFPRVVFTFWGGMRYALGLLSLLFLIYHLKKQKNIWAFLSGLMCALALLTSIDVGLCALFCYGATFLFTKIFIKEKKLFTIKSLGAYIAGGLTILLPYFLYLYSADAFFPFIENTISVATDMYKTFPDHIVEYQPRNLGDALKAMIPSDPHFKHLTPAYCYLFLFGFFMLRIKKQNLKKTDLPLIALAAYGFSSYVLAFRKIGASNFEMALQPEKLLLFYLLEYAFFMFLSKKGALLSTLKGSSIQKIQNKTKLKIIGINILFFLFIGSSIGYPIQRLNHRFFSFKYLVKILTGGDSAQLIPLHNEPSETLSIERVKGMHVPQAQAQNIKQLKEIIDTYVAKDEAVFMFPELGSYNFIIDRPAVGRFPMVSFSWIKDARHEELMQDLKKAQPPFAVLTKDEQIAHLKVFFQIKRNKEKYDEIVNYVHTHYTLFDSTPDLLIYKRID